MKAESKTGCAASTHKGVNWRSKYVKQVQQQRPESPTVVLILHERCGPRSVSGCAECLNTQRGKGEQQNGMSSV